MSGLRCFSACGAGRLSSSSNRVERGVEGTLIEDLATVDPVAFDSENLNLSPLGVKAFC